jgi:dipeptidyl aminopeptidase/acylaminoacyl peptidase
MTLPPARPRRLKFLSVLFAVACAAIATQAQVTEITEARMELLFRPWLAEQMALSPDGRHVAYTQQAGDELLIMVRNLDTLKLLTRIVADESRPLLHSKEKQRARLRFLGWADSQRLVFAPAVEAITAGGVASMSPEIQALYQEGGAPLPRSQRYIAPVMAVDADGSQPLEVLTAEDFDPTPGVILGFGSGKLRDRLLVESREQTSASGSEAQLIAVDVRTKARTRLSRENQRGQFFYDREGGARLSRQTDRGGGTSYLYRVPDTKRWEKLSDPAPGVSFSATLENWFGTRAMPVGFDADPNILLYAANAGRDTFGLYGLNLKTREHTPLAVEEPGRDLVSLHGSPRVNGLIFDRYTDRPVGVRTRAPRVATRWLDLDLTEVQREIEAKLPPGSLVSILEWNERRTRFLMQVTTGATPRRVGLYRRPEGTLVELLRSAPWLQDAEMHETQFVEFAGPDESMLSGFLTLPKRPRLNPPPLIVCFSAGLPPEPQPEFDAEALALADLGFIVFRLNQRGMLGLGAKARDALRRDPERVAGADAAAAVEWLATRHRIDRKRVAVMGHGFGAYLALRATQVNPELFRCGIAMDPILNFATWLDPFPDAISPDGASRAPAMISGGPPPFSSEVIRRYLETGGRKIHDLSLFAQADSPSVPVFVARREASDPRTAAIAAGVARLKTVLERRDLDCTTVTYNQDYAEGLPAARAKVYRALEEFINLNLYQYDVKIGPTRVVK